jgi:hypothetical protein
VYPHRKFHIDLESGAKPNHAWPYPVPVIYLEAFKNKKELMHLCEIKFITSTRSKCMGFSYLHHTKKRWQSLLGK